MRKWLLAGLLMVYFAFTSGFVFEATQQTDLTRMSVPYSFALSGERTGVVGIYTQEDIDCAKWIAANAELVTIADLNGYILLQAFCPDWNKLKVPTVPHKNLPHYEPQTIERVTFDNMPEHCYMFTTEWNARHQQRIESEVIGAGLRETLPLPDFTDYMVAYQSGLAKVYVK